MCFQKDGKIDQAARCIKSRILTKVVDYVLLVDKFEQQCVVLKCMLIFPWLKDHVQTLVIDQYLSNNALYEHQCLENIKKLYKQAGRCDSQQQFKHIIEDAMVFTTEVFTDGSPIYHMTSTPVNKPHARKSLCLFTNILDVKKTSTHWVGAAKYKHKEIKYWTTPWELKKKRKGN